MNMRQSDKEPVAQRAPAKRPPSQANPTQMRWDPVDDLVELQQQLSHVLKSWPSGVINNEFVPAADVEETDDAFTIEIELPGVKRDDVSIEVLGRNLVVAGERKERERQGVLRRRTRTVGRFRAEVVFAADIDAEHIDAHLDEGVLTIRIPKVVRERRRTIKID